MGRIIGHKTFRLVAKGDIAARLVGMKRRLALLFAILSGLYLLVMVPTLDPLPFLDEGLAMLIFLNALAALGIDLRNVFGKKKLLPVRVPVGSRDR